MRLGLLAALYGLAAGASAALVLWLMGLVTHLVWSGPDARWYIFAVVMAGGAIIAGLRHVYHGETLDAQLQDLRDPARIKRRETLLIAAMAVVAVAFGGAIGPEAGILAVVAELSALVTIHIARNGAEARLLSEAGAAGALGGLYGSPPAGAVIAQDNPQAPRWQLYLAALTGLLGFLVVLSRFLPEQPLHIALPAHKPAGDGTDMIRALLPAALGAIGGMGFTTTLPVVQGLLARAGGVVVQTLLGSALFAALATTLPILRFSGHHELEAMLHWGAGAGMAALMALALLKALALALCLGAGWRGGAAFPLLFIGAAAGASALWILPDIPPTVALVAGMAAALTAGIGKPLAAMLIALLIMGAPAVGPLCVGLAIGWAATRVSAPSQIH